MAKKRFNVSSTLKKNTEETKLPQKVALKKNTKDLTEVKQKVEAIHQPTTVAKAPTTENAIVEAKTEKKPKPIVSKKAKKEKIVRLTIDTPESLHRKLKIKSINAGKTMREYLLDMVCKDLGVKNAI